MLQVNVTDEMEKVKGCVLIDCTKESDSHTGSVSIHELTRKNFQNLFWKMSEGKNCQLSFIVIYVHPSSHVVCLTISWF